MATYSKEILSSDFEEFGSPVWYEDENGIALANDWGAQDHGLRVDAYAMKRITMLLNGRYDNGGLGSLTIVLFRNDGSTRTLVSLSDSHSNNSSGLSLVVDGDTIYSTYVTVILNYNVDIDLSDEDDVSHIEVYGSKYNSYYHNKMYFRDMNIYISTDFPDEEVNKATVSSDIKYYGKTHHKLGFIRRNSELCTSCKELKDKGVNTSGEYEILVGNEKVTVYCDMETDGGGWTRMIPDLGDLSGATWEDGDVITGYNKPTSCSSYVAQNFLFSNIKIPWAENRLDFTREQTIMQCPRFIDYTDKIVLPGARTFKVNSDGSQEAWSACAWGDNVWTYSCCGGSLGSLHRDWRIYGQRALSMNNHFSFFSTCSNYDDNGRYVSALWLR